MSNSPAVSDRFRDDALEAARSLIRDLDENNDEVRKIASRVLPREESIGTPDDTPGVKEVAEALVRRIEQATLSIQHLVERISQLQATAVSQQNEIVKYRELLVSQNKFKEAATVRELQDRVYPIMKQEAAQS
jgi:hypothetical protein